MARTAKKARTYFVNGDEWKRPAASLNRSAKRSQRRSERRRDFASEAYAEEWEMVKDDYDCIF